MFILHRTGKWKTLHAIEVVCLRSADQINVEYQRLQDKRKSLLNAAFHQFVSLPRLVCPLHNGVHVSEHQVMHEFSSLHPLVSPRLGFVEEWGVEWIVIFVHA